MHTPSMGLFLINQFISLATLASLLKQCTQRPIYWICGLKSMFWKYILCVIIFEVVWSSHGKLDFTLQTPTEIVLKTLRMWGNWENIRDINECVITHITEKLAFDHYQHSTNLIYS